MPHDVFISYSSKDRNFASAILTVLEYNRIQCWIDYRDIPLGANYSGEIIDAIDSCKIFLLVYSGNAAASDHILTEVDQAFSRKKNIITFKIDNTQFTKNLEYFLKARQWLDAISPPIEEHLAKLTKIIGTFLDKPSENPLIQGSVLKPFKKLEKKNTRKKGISWVKPAIAVACVFIILVFLFVIKPGFLGFGVAVSSEPPAVPSVFGNSQQNISNGGYAAFYEGWVYCAGSSDVMEDGLYKMKEDGTEKTMLSSDIPLYINVVKDWVYYVNAGDSKNIYKIRSDGRSRVKVCDDTPNNMLVCDDTIYYINASDDYKLSRIMTDGSSPATVSETPTAGYFFDDGWIYFLEMTDQSTSKIYKARMDGSEKEVVIDQVAFPTFTFSVADGWLYFADYNDSNRLYRMNLKDGQRLKLGFDEAMNINVAGDTLYYVNNSDNASIYKMSANGENRMKLCDGRSFFVNVLNDWVYYKEINTSNGNQISIGKLHRIRTDGSLQEALDF